MIILKSRLLDHLTNLHIRKLYLLHIYMCINRGPAEQVTENLNVHIKIVGLKYPSVRDFQDR